MVIELTLDHSSFGHAAAFTVVEILVVMTIILVLAGLVLATSSYVHNKGARSRAEAEIAAMSAALENYKADNGIYPSDISVDARSSPDPTAYVAASLTLYKALSGDVDNDVNRQADSGTKSYMTFKDNQLSPATGSVAYIKDPFGNSYGYSTVFQSNSTKGYNPTFDLWSTAGSSTSAAGWIKNW
jgi:type II secretory pathway pseudopilin PulG